MWKLLTLLVMLTALPCIALGVGLDTNLTLKAQCLDAYGNFCAETGTWTVLYPNGTAVDNETAGTASSTGLSSHTVWFNTTGAWFVLVNFSNINHTAQFNVVVEDYDVNSTSSIGILSGIGGEVDMISIAILIGILTFACLYAGFKLEQKEHPLLRTFLILISFVFLVGAGGVAVLSNSDSAISNTLDGIFYVIVGVLGAVLFYTSVYLVYSLVMKSKKMVKNGKGN